MKYFDFVKLFLPTKISVLFLLILSILKCNCMYMDFSVVGSIERQSMKFFFSNTGNTASIHNPEERTNGDEVRSCLGSTINL